MQNPSTRAARAFVAALPVKHVVLSPGSRSAPLALAFADRHDISLHVRIDERSAAFLALGMAKALREPVAVVCTSGTAAVNLAPAVTEAFEDDIPLLLLTADRPAELRGRGANQTIDQIGIFGKHVTCFDIDAPDETTDEEGWASIARGVYEQAARRSTPIHVNLQFKEPLVPERDS